MEALTELHCLRCDHHWWPRSPKPPKKCPCCNQHEWWRKAKKVGRPVTTGAGLRARRKKVA